MLPCNRRLTDFQARLVACAQTFCYIESVETTAQKERQRKKTKKKEQDWKLEEIGMILADKIAELRKKNGWSQEELAGRLSVSRQSVSKWESAASVPDLDKILKLSEIFGVSTDYLLKDSEEPEEREDGLLESARPGTFPEPDGPVKTISLEKANIFMDLSRAAAPWIASGVAACILSPIPLIFLFILSAKGSGFALSVDAAAGAGLTILLVMVAAAVALFLYWGRKLEPFEYLEEEPVELAYGVTGLVEKRKKAYESAHGAMLIIGVSLCIFSAIPLFLSGMEMMGEYGVLLCLAIVAAGVFLLVRTGVEFGSFQKLLEEGDYTRQKKAENKRNGTVRVVYWCAVTAIYLGWSFYTMEWERTWILWPSAGVLFTAVLGISNAVHKSREQ